MEAKELKERIIVGLLAWFLATFFLKPALSLVWRMIAVGGGLVHQGYVDKIYTSAALGSLEYGFVILGCLLLSLPLGGMYLTLRKMRAVERPGHPIVRAVHWAWMFMVAVSILVFFGLFSLTAGTKLIAGSFAQRLTVLAPAISDTEYKTLKARWAGMRGKADYDALVAAMDKRAAELGVTLPTSRKP